MAWCLQRIPDLGSWAAQVWQWQGRGMVTQGQGCLCRCRADCCLDMCVMCRGDMTRWGLFHPALALLIQPAWVLLGCRDPLSWRYKQGPGNFSPSSSSPGYRDECVPPPPAGRATAPTWHTVAPQAPWVAGPVAGWLWGQGWLRETWAELSKGCDFLA